MCVKGIPRKLPARSNKHLKRIVTSLVLVLGLTGICHGIAIDAVTNWKQMKLFQYIKSGNEQEAIYIIRGGIDVNCSQRESGVSFWRWLIHGIRANDHARHGDSALLASFKFNRQQFAYELLRQGAADINAEMDFVAPYTDDPEPTPNRERLLTISVARLWDDVAAELLNRGAEYEAKQLVLVASEAGDLKVVQMLITRNNREFPAKTYRDNLEPDDLNEALCCAASHDHVSIVKLLLANGASAKFRQFGSDGTPLDDAASTGDVELVQLLIAKGAKIDNNGRFGTPLLSAASAGKLNVVKYLVNVGANVNLSDYHDVTALAAASRNKHYDIVAYLKAHGARQ